MRCCAARSIIRRWQALTSGSARDAASGGSFNDPAFEEGGNAD
jgi:hypothetical protein